MKRSARQIKTGPTPPKPESRTQGRASLFSEPFVHVILLIVVCLATYCNSLPVPFTFDDFPYLVENPLIKDLDYFFDYSRIDGHHLTVDHKYNFILRPVTYFTFSINYLIHGIDPGGFRLVNILIHMSNALLIYLLVQRLLSCAADGETQDGSLGPSLPFVSFFSAIIFAVHPLQTQAVTYIVQRFTSLATLLYLLTIVLYLSFRSSRTKSAQVASYICALLAAICAMKAKEIAFTLPVVLVMIEMFFLKGQKFRRMLGLVPFIFTMAIIPATVLKLSESSPTAGSSALERGTNLINFSKVTTHDYFITQLRVIVTYLRLLFFPVQQNLDYDYPLFHSLLDYRIVLSLMVILSVVAMGIWFFRSSLRKVGKLHVQMRLISFGIFWFFITLSVESSIIPIDDLIYEHRVYLPSVGMILAFVTGLDMIREKITEPNDRGGRFVLVPVLVVLALATATMVRNDVWHNIWVDAAKKSPRKARPFNNHGDYLMKTNRPGEAIPWFRHAIELDPGNIDAYLNLGAACSDTGSFDEAERALNFVLDRRPGDYLAWNNLGTVYVRKGDFRKGVEMYRRSLVINPGNLGVQANLNQALMDQEAGRSAR